MAKGVLKDKVVEDARNRAFKASHLPKTISKSFNSSIKSGAVILTEKKASKNSGS